jgi:hypothetical protein
VRQDRRALAGAAGPRPLPRGEGVIGGVGLRGLAVRERVVLRPRAAAARRGRRNDVTCPSARVRLARRATSE